MAQKTEGTQASPASTKRQLLGLNGLRALACIGIVFYHLNQHRTTAGLAPWNWDLYKLTELLPMIVSFFFIIGAALHSMPFWRVVFTRDPSDATPVSLMVPNVRKSLIDRFFRIAPAYYAALIGTFVIVAVLQGATISDGIRLIAGLSFLSWIHPLSFFPVEMNGPLWFVPYDVMGGLLVLAVMHLFVRIPRRIIPIAYAVVIAILLALHSAFVSIPFPRLPGIVSEWFPLYNPFVFGIHFMIGILVGAAWSFAEVRSMKNSMLWDIVWIGVVAGLFGFLYSIRFVDIFDVSYPRSAYHFPFTPALLALVIGILPFTRFLGTWLDNPISNGISKISYSLYLWHALIIVLLCRWYFENAALDTVDWWMLVIATFAISLPIAYTSSVWVEGAAMMWKKKHIS